MKDKYVYDGEDKAQYDLIENYESRENLNIRIVEDGVFLPAKFMMGVPWGIGGVIDNNNCIVKESFLDDAFGGEYTVDSKDIVHSNEEVIYAGCIPRHWGHLLIDVLSRLWFDIESKSEYKIVYTGLAWEGSHGIEGNYYKLLELMGISRDRLIYVTEPTRFKKIIIPERALGFEHPWHKQYLGIVDKIVRNARSEAIKRGIKTYESIYFTRENFPDARKKEIGERDISQLFSENGYKIISIEQLDAVEQIFLINNCKNYVCISGTLSHNILFCNKDVNLTILNRTWKLNPPQIRINQLMGIMPTYVDIFDEAELKRKSGYRASDNRIIHVLGVNKNLINYCKDRNMKIPNRSGFSRLSMNAQKYIKKHLLEIRQILGELKYWIHH